LFSQEAVQPEGDTNFSNLIPHLETLLPQLHAPVVIKETGNGIDSHTAQQLADIGVKRIDVSGRGGTSRPAVEGYRRPDRLGKTIQRL
jgi:isopentenyl-diphosphate delta-isomerase